MQKLRIKLLHVCCW